MNTNMEDVDPRMNGNAVSVYDNAPADDFPVLKAFQQYIDAEQAKSRKRMMLLCVFFSFVLVAVIAVFVGLLLASSSRNQALNDRLVEYAMKDRDRAPAVAVKQDDSAIRALSDRLETLQRSLAEERERHEKAAEKNAAAEADAKRRSAEAMEIERLKALLAAEKAKAEVEHEKLRQAELEAYRRKQYPEFYGLKPNIGSSSAKDSKKKKLSAAQEEADREIESIINEVKTVSYFDDEDEDVPKKETKKTVKKTPSPNRVVAPKRPAVQKKDVAPVEDDVMVPTGVKDSSGTTWSIPEE